jgi:small subunit ribosomal protein S6
MKRIYETVVLLDAMLPDDSIESAIKEVEGFISQSGEIKKVDRMGKHRLAYQIKKKSHAFYAVFIYAGEGKLVDDLERKLRLNEKAIRFLTVCSEDPTISL